VSAIRGPRWGWHQLDSRWARRVVADAGVVPGDLVLDVGAGTGAITRALVAAGAHVVAIELHPQRAAYLRNQFDQRDVTVVRVDASDLRLPRRPFKVVSNPPFGVTTSLVKRLVSPGSRLIRADLLVPWHAAKRWSSQDAPGRGRWDSDLAVHLGRPPPRSAFRPPPPNDVAVLVVVRRDPSPPRHPIPTRRKP
jgi:23S rRNA (adenine-N6)-dimethyltransferase